MSSPLADHIRFTQAGSNTFTDFILNTKPAKELAE